MFKVSQIRFNIRTKTLEFNTLSEFVTILNELKNVGARTKPALSPGVFDGDRNLLNFREAYTICLDFDGTLGDTPEEARTKIHELFDDYTYIAVKSRNYMIPKGPVELPKPRYHIWFILEEPITDEDDYRATYQALLNNFSQADKSCTDPSRQFYAGQSVDWTHEGKCVKIIKADKQPKEFEIETIAEGSRGRVNKKTADFFIRGPQETSWHHETVAVLYDLKAQGYTKEEAIKALERIAPYPLDHNDMIRINDIYDNRTPRNQFDGEKMVFTLPDLTKRKELFEKDKELVKESLACQFSFIRPEFDKYFKLANGFHMVGAPTGRGKTTTASNIIAQYLKQSKKQVVIISNEENNFDVNGRIACVMLNKNFFKYRRDEMLEQDAQEVNKYIEEVRPRLAVITTTDDYDMTVLEDVQMVFEKVNEYEDVGLVVVDYLQTVVKSKETANASPYEVTKRLGTFMKEFCRINKLPVIGLVQMRPQKGDYPESYEIRVQGDRHLANHCVTFVEVVPNFENNITDFHVHKNRFGEKTIHPVQLLYANGSYQPLVVKNDFE